MNQLLIEEPKISNQGLAQQVIEEAIQRGIKEFCVAPGSRNAPLVYALANTNQVKVYYWPEERSSAFFALGRIKATGRPVAVVTTSGTAVAELLPAVMNAHYLGLPLLVITADRPRRFRGTGSPQTAEQVGLFGCYTHFDQDLEGEEQCVLQHWECRGPAHLNVCFEEPKDADCRSIQIKENLPCHFTPSKKDLNLDDLKAFEDFLQATTYPLVVVGGLHPTHKELAIQFLLNLNLPLYAEGFSGLREDPRLAHLRVTRIDCLWEFASQQGYPIDGILRIGEIPTARLWRDLEDLQETIKVCSISEKPFSGLSHASIIHTSLDNFFTKVLMRGRGRKGSDCQTWLEADRHFHDRLTLLFQEEPLAEPSLFHFLSSSLPIQSHIYLGNSLPIREWDLAATYQDRSYLVSASRGLNGIDGQISTFLGLSQPHCSNWAFLGDLTALYDMAGPWILSQMQSTPINLAIINNRGGQIFSRMFSLDVFPNPHHLDFEHLAAFWRMPYERWDAIPENLTLSQAHRLIEIVPDAEATARFWRKIGKW